MRPLVVIDQPGEPAARAAPCATIAQPHVHADVAFSLQAAARPHVAGAPDGTAGGGGTGKRRGERWRTRRGRKKKEGKNEGKKKEQKWGQALYEV